MHKRQKLLILILIAKLAMLMTLYLGFWIFIYEFIICDQPLWFALMSSAVKLVLFFVSFIVWAVLDMWITDMTTLPTFQIERDEKKTTKQPKEKVPKKEKPSKKDKDKKLPLY